MRILFLGDIVGKSGCEAITNNLPKQLEKRKIDFVIANGENAADNGFGITKKITNELFQAGVDVITTGNHVWDQREATNLIDTDSRLLRPINLISPSPGKGFQIFNLDNGLKIGY